MRLQNQMEWLYRAQLLLIYDDKRGAATEFYPPRIHQTLSASCEVVYGSPLAGVAAPEPSSTGWPENT